ncbi:hypothetical protein AYI69_g2839 [Smittium culicis]|uniref:Uncharacterized protein n=1 Tax=Smittium culicis TaxID=133412 RepID=A0A1R1YLV7_9FUNG|nr:hypothetical protein AYI69_g2839 [Smittium culicis]
MILCLARSYSVINSSKNKNSLNEAGKNTAYIKFNRNYSSNELKSYDNYKLSNFRINKRDLSESTIDKNIIEIKKYANDLKASFKIFYETILSKKDELLNQGKIGSFEKELFNLLNKNMINAAVNERNEKNFDMLFTLSDQETKTNFIEIYGLVKKNNQTFKKLKDILNTIQNKNNNYAIIKENVLEVYNILKEY